MRRWTKAALVMLLVLTVGCTGTPKHPTESPPTTGEERHRRYDELQNKTAGIPYVSTWYVDGRQDKLVIGVGTAEAKQAVQREMAKLGLPEGSVVIEHPQPLLSEAAPFAGCQSASRQASEVGRLIIPGSMRPGQEFELTVELDAAPDQVTRGVDSHLECWDGQNWSTRFMLLVGYGSPDARPTAWIAGNNVIDDLGLSGPGPEKLILPANIPPGWYRIRKHVTAGTTQHTLTAAFEVRNP